MQTQTIPSGDAPQQTNGTPRNSTDSFVDSALEAFESLGGDVGNDNATRRRKPADQPAAEPDGTGATEADEEVEDPVPGEADDEAEAPGEQDEEDEPEAHDTRGSKEEPFSVKDLPADRYIEIKVDGEKQVVSLAELATGYIGQATISQRLNKTKQLTDEAQALAQKARETQESVRGALKDFVSDPDQLFEYFLATGEREKVLEAVAMRYAETLKKFRVNPEERLRFERRRDEARLQAEREHWEQQKQAEVQARQQAEMQERAMKVFKPGWEAGIKRAGFPQPTQQLYEEVVIRCNQRAASGAQVTSADVEEFTLRACKLLELPPKGAKRPRPAPAPAPRAERTTQRRGRDPWAGKSPAEKRKDPDYFLKNLRSRDFRG